MTTIRAGTRASPLALAQTGLVLDRLRAAHRGLAVELVRITTRGDADRTTPLNEGVGWFTTALQDALREGAIDFAVHSYKDLPTARPEGLAIVAIPLREDPRDAFVSAGGRPLREQRQGAVIGTSSPRREAQLRAMGPGLEIRPIRGNVDTRLRLVLEEQRFDGVVVALAGLRRLGREDAAVQIFGLDEMLPAPAQGALAVECRADDAATRSLLAAVDDPSLRASVQAERAFLAALEAGCSYPAAACAELFGTTLKLHGLIAPGGRLVRGKMAGSPETAAGLGRELARELLARSAG